MKKISDRNRNFIFTIPFIVLLIFCINIPVAAKINPRTLENNARKMIDRYYFDNDFYITANDQDVVTIKGTVNTLYDKLRARELVSRVPGIKEINSEITIDTPLLPDKEIQDNIIDEIKYNSSILEPDKIKVNVHDGTVTLSGDVNYYHEKLMVQSIASWQDGVQNMISNIKVLAPNIERSDENLYEILTDVLKDRFPLEKNIAIDVNNGVVTASGSVRSLWAKDHIADEIHQIVGVKSVENNLVVIQPDET